MKIKVVQDSIIFISALTMEQFQEATRFCPSSLVLNKVNEESKKAEPVCMIAYNEGGSVSGNGIVFDSTTDEGYLCKTLVAIEGNDPHVSAEDKVTTVSQQYAGLILKVNALEGQIVTALADNSERIESAKASIEVVRI